MPAFFKQASDNNLLPPTFRLAKFSLSFSPSPPLPIPTSQGQSGHVAHASPHSSTSRIGSGLPRNGMSASHPRPLEVSMAHTKSLRVKVKRSTVRQMMRGSPDPDPDLPLDPDPDPPWPSSSASLAWRLGWILPPSRVPRWTSMCRSPSSCEP